MEVFTTARLRLRRLTADDAAFILELVNDEAWLRYIGDRGIRSLDDARAYLERGPVAMYAKHGFGLWGVERKEAPGLVGMCGLLQRDTLPDVDLGFAFLPAFRGQGLAREAAAGTVAFARDQLGLRRLVALTAPANARSIRLLEGLGFCFEQMVRLVPAGPESNLLALAL